jgi:serine/threonine protein kinase
MLGMIKIAAGEAPPLVASSTVLPTSVEVRVGSVFGAYRIDALLARGGMGVVYDAYELTHERRVALKVIAPELATDATFRVRFKRESRIAMQVEHPHVVPVYGAGAVAETLYIAMRFIDGVDLGTLVKRERSLDGARAIRLIEQIGSGVDAAHRLGLVHADIKPANVMVQKLEVGREHAYIMDFGLAKPAGSTSVTQSGHWLATLDYVAPELIQGAPPDARTDVYALGATLFHMLTGRAPFAGKHRAAKLFAHLNAEPPKVTETRPHLPKALDRVVARAMAKRPADRFPSAADFARAVGHVRAAPTSV